MHRPDTSGELIPFEPSIDRWMSARGVEQVDRIEHGTFRMDLWFDYARHMGRIGMEPLIRPQFFACLERMVGEGTFAEQIDRFTRRGHNLALVMPVYGPSILSAMAKLDRQDERIALDLKGSYRALAEIGVVEASLADGVRRLVGRNAALEALVAKHVPMADQ